MAVSRTDILGGGGAGRWGVLLLRVARILRGEVPTGVSAASFLSFSYMAESLSGLSNKFNPWGLVRLNVGGGSFSWSLVEGSGGREGTLKAGCSCAPEGLEKKSEDAGVDLDWDPYDLGEDGRENTPSAAGTLTGRSNRGCSMSGLGSAHDTFGEDGFVVPRSYSARLSSNSMSRTPSFNR